MEITEKISEKINPITLKISLKSLYPRYTANRVVNVEPKPTINPPMAAITTNTNPKIMLFLERKRFCFTIFLLLTIINDIFFNSCLIPPRCRFYVSSAISV